MTKQHDFYDNDSHDDGDDAHDDDDDDGDDAHDDDDDQTYDNMGCTLKERPLWGNS